MLYHHYHLEPLPNRTARAEDRWLDCEEDLQSTDHHNSFLAIESAAPAYKQQVVYKGTPKYRHCQMTQELLQDKVENSFICKIYNKGTYCTINGGSSKGRPIKLSVEDSKQVELHVSALLTAGLVCVSKWMAFVSFPFVVPKALENLDSS